MCLLSFLDVNECHKNKPGLSQKPTRVEVQEITQSFEVFQRCRALLHRSRKLPALIRAVSELISPDLRWISAVQCWGKELNVDEKRSYSVREDFCVIWLWKMPASGWGSLWELSSFVPWSVPNAFRDVSGAVLEWPWVGGFMRKWSRRANAPNMRFSVILNTCDNFFVTLPSISSSTLSYVAFLWSGNIWVFAILLPGCSSQFFLFNAANFFLFPKVANFYGKSDCWRIIFDFFSEEEIEMLFYSLVILEVSILVNIIKTIIKVIKVLNLYFHIFYLYLFHRGKHSCLHAKSRYEQGKVLYKLPHQSQDADSGRK